MDDLTVMQRALAATGTVVGNVRPDQYTVPTPCPSWDVRTLMNHIVAGNRYFGSAARGEKPDMSIWAADHLGDADPGTVYEESAASALDAWRSGGATDLRATLPSGAPGPRTFDMHLMDVFVHGWDLATATGQDRALDEEVAQAVYDAWYGKVPEEIRGGVVFDAEVECPPDAPLADRLVAYFGRTP